jgi:4-cresol dehydrogenase (hydroxylating)
MTKATSSSASRNISALCQALEEVELLVGKDHISRLDLDTAERDVSRRNVSLFRSRDIRATIRPSTVDDVQEIVRAFNRNKTDVGLHAISTGRNWGLGSAEPASDGVVTIDLGRMKTTRRLDCASGWAVIEPGVTQIELAESLAGTERMINVTASSGYTSIVGNALERGVGLRHQRTEDLVGLEVVLPDGELVRVGWWPDDAKRTAINSYGHGPSLLHLFTQSNLGIVTAAVIKLLPRPEKQCVLRLTFARETLRDAINTLRRWVAQDLVSGVLKVYDAISTTSYGGSPGEHLVLLCISGSTRRVDAISRVVLEEAEESELFTNVSLSEGVAADANDFVLQVVEHAYAGCPARNEHMLRSATGADADHVDSVGGGWIFFLAFVPFDSSSVARAFELIDQIHRETGVHAGTTINALSSDVIDLVVSLKFPPTPEATRRAHGALDLIYELFTAAGFYPYRLDIDHSHWRQKLSADPRTLHLSRRIKQLIDPNSIIAPGRYA